MKNKPKAITKTLSLNDSGETGGHQAGICVPKGGDILRFFPDLGNEKKIRGFLFTLRIRPVKSGSLILFIIIINFLILREHEMSIDLPV